MGSSESKKKWDCTRYLNGNAPLASQANDASQAPWPVCPTCGQSTAEDPVNHSNGTVPSKPKKKTNP